MNMCVFMNAGTRLDEWEYPGWGSVYTKEINSDSLPSMPHRHQLVHPTRPIYPSTCLSAFLPACPPACLSACQSARLTTYLPACFPAYLPAFLHACFFALSTNLSTQVHLLSHYKVHSHTPSLSLPPPL